MIKKRRIVIYSPRQKWGGPIVLHVLCKCLNELGYDATVFYSDVGVKNDCKNRVTYWRKIIGYYIKDTTKIVLSKIDSKNRAIYNGYRNYAIHGCKRKFTPFIKENDIVIYPDIVYGNPLGAKNVVRYLLYYYQYKNDPKAYDDTDIFVAFREEFNDNELNHDNFIMTIPYFDLEYYKQTNFAKREGKCYIIRKGKDRDDLPSSLDGIIIDDLAEDDKIKVFNESEYCISYDLQTAYSSLAALCGCKSVIVPLIGKTPESYRNSDDPRYGVAVGFSNEQLRYAEETIEDLRKNYLDANKKSLEQVRVFANKLDDYFKK